MLGTIIAVWRTLAKLFTFEFSYLFVFPLYCFMRKSMNMSRYWGEEYLGNDGKEKEYEQNILHEDFLNKI